MRGVSKRLASQGVRVVLESSGAKAILAASYDPNYGARPVERYLESTVVTTLSRMLISGDISSGSIVRIEAAEGDDESYDDISIPLRKKARLTYSVQQATEHPMETDEADVSILEDGDNQADVD
jgi:ATP-dependent Clp protease ATP-binding subunit ClpA